MEQYDELVAKMKEDVIVTGKEVVEGETPKMNFAPKVDIKNPENPIQTSQTITPSSTVDDSFTVTPVIKEIISAPQDANPVTGQLTLVQPQMMNEDEMTGLLTALLTLPTIIKPKLPPRTPEQIKPFAHELTLYCQKKGINARDYLFDELGLVLTGVTLGAGIYQDYQKAYGKDKIEDKKEDKKLTNDFDNLKRIEEINANPVKVEEKNDKRPDGSSFIPS